MFCSTRPSFQDKYQVSTSLCSDIREEKIHSVCVIAILSPPLASQVDLAYIEVTALMMKRGDGPNDVSITLTLDVESLGRPFIVIGHALLIDYGTLRVSRS